MLEPVPAREKGYGSVLVICTAPAANAEVSRKDEWGTHAISNVHGEGPRVPNMYSTPPYYR